MGLDVYTYHNAGPHTWEEVDAAMAAWDAAEETVPGGWGSWDAWHARRDELFAAGGAWTPVLERRETVSGPGGTVFYEPVGVTRVRYPLDDRECASRVGYLRSSYNDRGINNVLRRLRLPDLYSVFEPPSVAGTFVPDWEAALGRARELRERFAEVAAGYDLVRVDHLRPHASPAAALEAATAVLTDRKRGAEDSAFWTGGLTVYAVVAIADRSHLPGRSPDVRLVVRRELHEGYAATLDCAVATCELALSDGRGGTSYRLVWSA